MRRFYIKMRTLIVLAVLFGLVFSVMYIGTPKLMALKIKEHEQAGNQHKAMVLKERLIRFFPGSEEARWEVYSFVDRILQREEGILIGPDFTGGGSGEDILVHAEETIDYLKKIAKAQKEEMWKYNIYERLGELYRLEGDYPAAEENYMIAAQGFALAKKDFRIAEVYGRLVDMYLETGELEKALSLIEESLENYSDQYRSEFLSKKGDVYFQLGDYPQAEKCYREALEEGKKDWDRFISRNTGKDENINATLDQQPVYRHSKSRLEMISSLQTEVEGEEGKVTGEIFAGNVPMPNIIVYLINEKDYDGRMSHLEGIITCPPNKTDNMGRFLFDSVPPGKYFIVLEMQPEDLEGLGRFKGLKSFTVEAGIAKDLKYVFQPKVKIIEPVGQKNYRGGAELKIVWDQVPEAVAYSLQITLKLENGYVSRVYRKNIEGNSYVFNPQGLALREMSFGVWGDGYILHPAAVLGSFYPGAEIYFAIEALDKEGKYLSDSEGYVLELNGNYPSIRVEDATPLSNGDKLVLEKNYPEAVHAYINELKEKPQDPYALLSLARLYNFGWTEGTADLEKAVEYYAEVLKINRDKFILEEAAGANVQAGNDEIAVALYEEIEDEMRKSIFWFHQMGELYFRIGEISKAQDYYLKYMNEEKTFRDLGPVVACLYLDDVLGAIKLLKENSYSERVRYNQGGDTEKPADINVLIDNLERYNKGEKSVLNKDEFNKYLMELMSIRGSSRFGKVLAFQSKVKSRGEKDVLVLVLEELAKDRR